MRLFYCFFLAVFLCFSSVVMATEPTPPVNINSADAATLSAGLIGVGESKARAIVTYRETYGPFESLEELTAVKGIGESLLKKNLGNIVLK